ncbi:MAG: efflux RND transporter periplasmic adaptor subunit [Sedimentisphaerales bacterium]
MKRGHRVKLIVVVLLVLVACAAAGYWYVSRSQRANTLTAQPPTSPQGPTSSVQVVSLKRQKIEETLVVYGTVVAALGKTETFSVPFESRVESMLVTTGPVVDANAALVAIGPSPDTLLSLAQARSERDSARDSLKLVQQRLKMKLTTQQNLVSAQQKVQAAELKVKSMEDRGIDGRKIIRAKSKGVVSRIDVDPGQIVSAGTTLVEMIGQHEISVRLGIENEDIGSLRLGQNVELYPVNAPDKRATRGTIALITQRVNPQTRLVDVFVTPHDGAVLMLNEYLEARVVLASELGFVVPRSAVLSQQGDHILYTVQKGRAVRHVVHIGLETPAQIQVLGDDLHAGEQVVIVGNYELHDGMAVVVEPQK